MARTKGAKDKSPRKKTMSVGRLTSTSSDAQITKWLSTVNRKISGYYAIDDEVGERFAHQIETQLTWRKYTVGGEFGEYSEWELPLVERNGKLQIDIKTKVGKQIAIDHIKKVLREEEEKEAASTIQDKIDSMSSVAEKKQIVKKQLEEGKAYTEEGKSFGTMMSWYDEEGNKRTKREYNSAFNQAIINEMIERARRDWEDDFSDVLDILYEDEETNADVIAKLKGGQWTAEIMEEANARTIGIKPTRH